MNNNQNQYKFTEGEVHSFKITGYKEIPGTDESFFILENPFGGKHLLKANPYKHYEFEINQTIKCKIDKINCSGKIYLEPENPIYKEGNNYHFTFVIVIEHINSVGEKEKAAILKDRFGKEVICSIPQDCKLSGNIKNLKCKVLRIKKGQLFLALPDALLKENDLKIGERYWFTLVEIKQLEHDIDYYILKDEFNNLYSLNKDMYKHYGFKINQQIECTVTKYNTDGHLKIEPVHPYYETGKTYPFKFLRTEQDFNPLGKEEKVIIVEDIYGVETKVRSSNLTNFSKPFPIQIQCKVEGIRKGKAILSFV